MLVSVYTCQNATLMEITCHGSIKANLKNIFVSPYPTLFTGMGQSVGFFLTSQIGYPLNLIVYSKTCLKRPLKKNTKIVCFFKTDYRIMQVKSIA